MKYSGGRWWSYPPTLSGIKVGLDLDGKVYGDLQLAIRLRHGRYQNELVLYKLLEEKITVEDYRK